jgi:catechol 2,3-dioxygenase-like lactoylglutathione lyase family enzyme
MAVKVLELHHHGIRVGPSLSDVKKAYGFYHDVLGLDATLDTIPYFYTDQFDVSMEYSGFPSLVAGPPVIRGSLPGAANGLVLVRKA